MSIYLWVTLNAFALVYLESKRHKYGWEQRRRIAEQRPNDRWF